MNTNWNLIALITGIAFYGYLAWMLCRRQIAAGVQRIMNLPRGLQAIFAAVAVVATVEAQKAGTNGVMNAGQRLGDAASSRVIDKELTRQDAASPSLRGALGDTITADEIAAGYRFVSTTNDATHSFAMPANGVRLGNAHIHGAHSNFGRNVVSFNDWSFPFGPTAAAYSTFWYFIEGYLKTSPFSERGIFAAEYDDVLLMQGESSMWCANGSGNEMIFTWQNIFPNGDTNSAANLQIVLRDNGDFETWSNEVCNVYARIDPFDWDGDGIANVIDDTPVVSDGTCFGTGVDWLNANCRSVLSAAEGENGEIIITWNTNPNENAYYWLHFTAQKDGTHISIECDGPSALGDLYVIANSNMVCSVPLLIGAQYEVNATWPLSNIWADNEDAEFDVMETPRMAGGTGLTRATRLEAASPKLAGATASLLGDAASCRVRVPVNFSMSGSGGSGTLTTDPDVGASISCITGSCCEVDFDGNYYSWECNCCECGGYSQTWEVTASWEGYSTVFSWETQCPCQAENETNSTTWASLSAPLIVMVGGEMGAISVSFEPPDSAEGASASLSVASSGGAIVEHWTSTNKTSSVGLPLSIFPGGTTTFYVEGITNSTALGDVEYQLEVSDGSGSYVITQALTVVAVKNMNMLTIKYGNSPNWPPFDCGVDYPFCETNSLNPDKHLVIPYWNVVNTNDMSIQDFTVTLELAVEPDIFIPGEWAEWELVEARPQISGTFQETGRLTAEFRNPTQGGVYRFRGRYLGSPWCEGNVVLPLSGASVDQRIVADMALANEFANKVIAKFGSRGRYSAKNGYDWFFASGRGDYLGRPDNSSSPTVWQYNQVDYTGKGGCCTWHGYPIRIAKLSNFLIAHTCEKIGVTPEDMQTAKEHLGNDDDESASLSWEAGVMVAAGANYLHCVSNVVRTAFLAQDDKTMKLWPNTCPLDNYYSGIPTIYEYDPDYNFYSVFFIFMDPE